MDKLQWGNRKWLRRLKLKGSSINGGGNDGDVVEKRASSGGVNGHHDLPPIPSNHHLPHRSSASVNGEASKEEKCNSSKRRQNESSNSKKVNENEKFVWPRLLIALSSKEKEEDFMTMKGCKPSQRPKKRAKSIQKNILSVSPGVWLSDICQERYQVREEKACKKKPSGLKAMESMEMDSE